MWNEVSLCLELKLPSAQTRVVFSLLCSPGFTTCLTQIYPQNRSQICLMLRDNWDSFTTEKAATTIGGKAEQDIWDFNSILIGLTATQYTIIASLQCGINDSESSDLAMCEQTTLHAKNARQTYADNTDIYQEQNWISQSGWLLFFNVLTVTFWPAEGRKEGRNVFWFANELEKFVLLFDLHVKCYCESHSCSTAGRQQRVRAEHSGGPIPKAVQISLLI